MRSRITWILLGLLIASCAIPEAPPGGPEDKTPPEVTVTSPANRSSGVAPSTPIEITFSEKMKRANVDRLVVFSPDAGILKTRWKKNRIILTPEEPLHTDTTYVVRIETGYADAHGVRAEEPFHFAFATSAVLDTGTVSGTVYYRRVPTGKAFVKLFVLPRDSSFTPESALADREARTNEDGSYKLEYLPANGTSFLIWAFEDGDGSGFFNPDNENGALFPDTATLEVSSPNLTLPGMYIIDPKEPAEVAGQILNETAYDSTRVTVTLHAVSDTLPPTYRVLSDLEGKYTFQKVLGGTYTLHAFIDLAADSLCGTYPCGEDSTRACPEPCATYPDTLILEPGDEVKLDPLPLLPAEE